MTISQTQDFLSEFVDSDMDIPSHKLAYAEARLGGLIHQFLLRLLRRMEGRSGFSKRKFSRRIGKRPELITRWFAAPGNLTIRTLADISAGAGYEIRGFVVADLATGKIEQFPDVLGTQMEAVTFPSPSGSTGSAPKSTTPYIMGPTPQRVAA